jgi:hypothetical protein
MLEKVVEIAETWFRHRSTTAIFSPLDRAALVRATLTTGRLSLLKKKKERGRGAELIRSGYLRLCHPLLYLPQGRKGGTVKDKSDSIGDQTNNI